MNYVSFFIKWTTAYACGFGMAAAVFSGNWLWLLLWLLIAVGAVLDAAIAEISK